MMLKKEVTSLVLDFIACYSMFLDFIYVLKMLKNISESLNKNDGQNGQDKIRYKVIRKARLNLFFNQMSSKIKAAIRVRPFLPSQKKQGFKNSLIEINKDKHEINIREQSNALRKFHFDYLFDPNATQEDLYKQCKIESMIDKALEGYHSTIFAYGQTGSGKTHTMQGSESVEDGSNVHIDGVIPTVIKDLFRKVQSFHHKRTFSISVSFLQIYNQKIFDLLNPSSLNNKNLSSNINGLRLRWNKDQQFSVQNLFVFECKNQEELMKFFLYGLKNRISSAHRLNMQSSRSHSIMTIRIQSFMNDDPSQALFSKLELVDLAGSERIGMTGTQGRLAKESIDINKSLFTLRQVISILSEAGKSKGKQKIHVPYRDSKLTSILKQSIGGNSYSLMIACINPNDQFLEQNISTLTYATKASYITNQPVINDDPRNKLINQLKKQVKQLNQQLGKANQHIEFMSNLNNQLNSTQRDPSIRMNNTNHSFNSTHPKSESPQKIGSMRGGHAHMNAQEASTQNDMPVPMFKKRFSQKVNNNYGEFSQRLIQSINMVRELLKGNKELREQLQINNKELEQKNLDIYELTRENQMLREKLETGSNFGFQQTSKQLNHTNNDIPFDVQLYDSERPRSNFKPRSTVGHSSNNIYGMALNNTPNKTALTHSRGNFNYWNSVQINQFYMNQRGIDSQPTNFNKREINTAQDRRQPNSRGKSSDSDRHAITAKLSTRRNWMSKHSEPKKFLSFYNESQKQHQLY